MINQKQSVNIRELVLPVLVEVLEKGAYSSVVIHNTLVNYQYLEKQDRAFFQRLSEGTIERMIELDYILNLFSKVKTTKMKPVIRNIMRMAVYQMKYMKQVPDRAACNEAVKLAVKKGFSTLKGFVNGVLRTISRDMDSIVYPNPETDPESYLSIIYSTPLWLVEKWNKEYGFCITEKMLSASFEEKNISIRCNLNQTTPKYLTELLETKEIIVKSGEYLPYALHIEGYNYINQVPGFLEGYFQVQDESSMLASEAAGVKEGDRILDVCSAPGGKSTHLAEKLKGTGIVVARDLTENKVSLIEENIKRNGYTNVKTEVLDACILVEEDIEQADIVMADLPCSGLGIIGKKTDIKYKVSKESIESLIRLQRDILHAVCQYVKPGGVLIFSTCTVNKEENIENVRWFLKEHPFSLESLDGYLPKELLGNTTKEGYLQLIPGRERTDGFFLARLKRN